LIGHAGFWKAEPLEKISAWKRQRKVSRKAGH
jgi:hypothetical protein